MFMCVGLHMHKRSLRAHWISGGLFIACLLYLSDSTLPNFLFFLWSCHMACGILVPLPGRERMPMQQEHQVLTETIYLRLGLHPMCQYLNPAKTQSNARTEEARTQIQPKHRLGLAPVIFSLVSLAWCLDLLRLRFFVSHCRKNSVRDKVIGKKWILFREKHYLQTVCEPSQRVSAVALKCGVVSYYGLGNFIG